MLSWGIAFQRSNLVALRSGVVMGLSEKRRRNFIESSLLQSNDLGARRCLLN